MSGETTQMKDAIIRTAVISNQRGLHARAAAKFVKVVSAYKAKVHVTRDGQTVSGASIMGLMMLAAGTGTEIELRASGNDAENVLEAICELIAARFDEE